MNRRNTLLEIAESFEDDFAVSLEPDLPELFEGPDLLAGKSGRLIAVFVPKYDELRNPERLRTRLILSRLALPDHVLCLLAIDDANDTSGLEGLSRDFHAVVNAEDRSGLRRQRTKSLEHRKIPDETRRMVEGRMAFLLTLSLAHQPVLETTPNEVADDIDLSGDARSQYLSDGNGVRPWPSVPAWPDRLLTRTSMLPSHHANVTIHDGVLVAGRNGSQRSIHQRIRPYVTLAAQTAFRVDDGVPYLGHPTAGVFIVQDARWPRADPLKPLRASAFAGWALLGDPSKDQFTRSVKQASEWLKGTVSERA